MSTARVAVIFGGRSSEHSISCISAAAVWEALEAAQQLGYTELASVLLAAQDALEQSMLLYHQMLDLQSMELPIIYLL
ncbi:MAG: hypothetical protein EBY60_00440 [Actinobacteria bacterium]|nr:hypothetical protein [Actinomycetota bacterium]